MKPRLALAALVALAGLAAGCSRAPQAQSTQWTTFHSQGGWSMNYPTGWTIGTCNGCADPTAAGVFVQFFPPNSGDGWVNVEPMPAKPANQAAAAWLNTTASSNNLNEESNTQPMTLAGCPALRVEYDSASGTDSIEAVYVVCGARTMQVQFSSDQNILPVVQLPYYATFQQMLTSFKLQSSQ